MRLPQDAQERRPKVLSSVIYTDHDGHEVVFAAAVRFESHSCLFLQLPFYQRFRFGDIRDFGVSDTFE